MNYLGKIIVTTVIKTGDHVWILSDFFVRPASSSIRGEVLSKIDENWFRIYSSHQTIEGEKTNIQDLPSEMLRRVYDDESG
jgi:hypothetical protein